MRKTIVFGIAISFFISCIAGCSDRDSTDSRPVQNDHSVSQMPFRELSADEISSISVYAVPPDETVTVDDIEQIETIVEILRTVVIYQKSDEWKGRTGQGVIFTITKTTGDVLVVRPYGQYLIIDGQGYRTEYQPSENLNRIANTVLGTSFGGMPIE